MSSSFTPTWTTTLPQASTRDPLRVDGARGTIRGQIFPYLSAVASRTRLRYLSFLVWCLDNQANEMERSLEVFETQFLLGSKACSDDTGPMGGSGFVGGGRDVPGEEYSIGEIVDQETPPIDIAPERLRLHSGGEGYSDRYARMVNDLGLVEPDSDELTSLGKAVAAAYDDAVDVAFSDVEEQATDGLLTNEFLSAFQGSGCACSLSEKERDLYRQLFFGLYTHESTSSGETMSFMDSRPEEPADLTPVFNRYQAVSATPEIESVTAEFVNNRDHLDSEDVDAVTKYNQFVEGRPVFARGSFLFVLGMTAQHNAGREHPVVGDLDQVADLWALHNLTRKFVTVNEQLLALVVELHRVLEPTTPQSISQTIVETPSFQATLEKVPEGVEISPSESEDNPTGVRALRQAAMYGDWHHSPPDVSFNNTNQSEADNEWSSSVNIDTWGDLLEKLGHETANTRPTLDAKAPWVLYQLFDAAVGRARDAARMGHVEKSVGEAGEAVGIAAQLFTRWQTWYDQFFTNRANGALTPWMKEHFDAPPSNGSRPIGQSISPRLLWEFPYQSTGSVADIMASYLETYIIRRYVGVMYRKYDSNGRAPTFLTIDEEGKFYFEAPYTRAGPNPNIYKQVADVLCELGLLETNNRNDLKVTDAGKTVVDRLCNEVPTR